jgi:hypothetical protein
MFRFSSDSSPRTAQQAFLLGERSLRAYLAGGNLRFLRDAETNFSALRPHDKAFTKAQFFLGITKSQLRESAESIEIFQNLRSHVDRDMANQISLQMAYAQIKKYNEEGYAAAERELNQVQEAASTAKNEELLLQTKAVQVFLYSVLSGRSKNEKAKPEYAVRAIKLGEEILAAVSKSPESTRAHRFEALNALGIAWMRVGQYEWPGFDKRAVSWARAESFYNQALEIIPNSVRVLQNMAALRILEVELGSIRERDVLLKEAKQFCELSLEVSDQDRYPFYLLAKVSALQGKATAAREYISIGRTKPGAVTDKQWAEIEDLLAVGRAEAGID